ncbi:MAG: type II toxin-antitoxin system HicA family toxin [Candidatus Hydrogenedentes bacterium]|nr:type II toxin-antitoxin system HicA family toxin [Candidatus Hydrogenedentota bacterium]
MSRLPSLRPREVVAALKRAGFQEAGQSGSHLHLAHADGREVVIPIHGKDLKRGTLMAILKQVGYSLDKFKELL